jgi:hypothetical protein
VAVTDEDDRVWIEKIVEILAGEFGIEVEDPAWLPDTADCEHLRLVVDGKQKRMNFSKRQIKNFMHHELALERVLVQVLSALGKTA